MIRDAVENDAGFIAEIYNYYIQNSVATFEDENLSVSDINDRINKIQNSGFSWLVAEEAGNVIGYAYSSKWQERPAYRNTAEVTVYLSHNTSPSGWGTKLYNELFSRLRKNSTHTIVAGITLPNSPSVALHEKFGMEQVAHFTQVGQKIGRWLDVGYWQVQLNTDPF